MQNVMTMLRLTLCGVSIFLGLCVASYARAQIEPPEDCEPFDYGALNEPSSSYQQFEGRTVRSIVVKRINVFDPNDPKENNALYRLMNRLHINTKENVIRSQLLFAAGDTLNVADVAESERILRAKHYLTFAAIHVNRVCTEGVELLVVTRDVWTTEPIFNYSREGGDTKRGIGFKEGNLLGRGSELSLVFDQSAERSRTQYNYSSPHLLNTHLRLRLGYIDTSDGQSTNFGLDRPFFSLKSRWAMGVFSSDTTLIEKIRYQDAQINAYKRKTEVFSSYVGLGFEFDDDAAHRVLVGLHREVEEYDPTEATELGLPIAAEYTYPWVEYRYIQDVFGVYRNLDLLHRVEDVPLGADVRIRVGHGGSFLGNDVEFSYLDFEFSDVLSIGKNQFFKFNAMVNGTWAKDATFSHNVWGGGARYYFLSGDFHRYFAELRYHQGHNLLQHEELTAGGENGLRGYPLDYQRGDKRWLLTLENRYITPWHFLNLLRIGAVGFVDAGHVWGAGYGKSSVLANAGVGLRLSSSKAKLDHIAHLDLAFPLVDRDQVDEFQLVMKVEAHF